VRVIQDTGTRLTMANQRKFKRFQVKGRAVAVLGNWTITFDIIDISENGLAFCYVGKDKWVNEDLLAMDLYYENDFCLKELPIISISDFLFRHSFIPMRRHSVMFDMLSPQQQTQLQYFLNNYTVGQA
jgi:hypothetical protein